VPLTSAGNKAHDDLLPGLIPTSPVIADVGTSVIDWSDNIANLAAVPRTTMAWPIPPVAVGIAVGIAPGDVVLFFLHPAKIMLKDSARKAQTSKRVDFFIFFLHFLNYLFHVL
jgi:hypothetical protein